MSRPGVEDLLGQPGLADARLAPEQHQAAPAPDGFPQPRFELGPLGLTADIRGPTGSRRRGHTGIGPGGNRLLGRRLTQPPQLGSHLGERLVAVVGRRRQQPVEQGEVGAGSGLRRQ